MSTSNSQFGAGSFDFADTAALTRLANELFAALPGEHPKLGAALTAAPFYFLDDISLPGGVPVLKAPAAKLDIHAVRRDFPILREQHGQVLRLCESSQLGH